MIIESNASNIETITIPISLSINQEAPLLGDINFDDDLNVLDVVTMMQLILNGSIDQTILFLGDINLDNELNILASTSYTSDM